MTLAKLKKRWTFSNRNAIYLKENAKKYDSEELKDYSESNEAQVELFDQDDASFKRSRKAIREEQHSIQTQQKSTIR